MAADDGDLAGGVGGPTPAAAWRGFRPSPGSEVLSLPPDPAAVGAARRWLSAALPDWSPDGAKTAALVVSELVGNVVLHARTQFELSVVRQGDGVRIEVSDLDPTTPSVKGYGAQASTGRGLRLVSLLSDDWGVRAGPDGKTVWAEMQDGPIPEQSVGDPPTPAGPEYPVGRAEATDPPTAGGLTATAIGLVAQGGHEPVDLVEVEILGFPLQLYLDLQEHNDALMREFALMADELSQGIPGRLISLARELQTHFVEATGSIRAQLAAARADGRTTVDLLMPIPRGSWPDLEGMANLLDEADRFCVEGDLLTLASSPEVRDFRRWFTDQVRAQVGGEPPTSWVAPT